MHHGDGTGHGRVESFAEVLCERSAVRQFGQVVVQRRKPELLLGAHSRLQLREQCRNRFERVEFCLGPRSVADLDEAEDAGGAFRVQQRHDGHRGRGESRRVLDAAAVVLLLRVRPKHCRFGQCFGQAEHRVCFVEVDHCQWVGIGHAQSRWPFCAESGGPGLEIVVPEEAEVDAQVVHELPQHGVVGLAHRRRIDSHEFGCDAGDEDLERPIVLQGPTPASRRRSAGLFPLVFAATLPRYRR